MNGLLSPSGFEPAAHLPVITIALFLLWWGAAALANACGLMGKGGARTFLWQVVLFHLIFGPPAVYILVNDAQRPERPDLWYRNPDIAVPYCVVLEVFIVSAVVYVWRLERRKEKGLWLLKEALRLQAEGEHGPAEVAYQKGMRLLGMKPR